MRPRPSAITPVSDGQRKPREREPPAERTDITQRYDERKHMILTRSDAFVTLPGGHRNPGRKSFEIRPGLSSCRAHQANGLCQTSTVSGPSQCPDRTQLSSQAHLRALLCPATAGDRIVAERHCASFLTPPGCDVSIDEDAQSSAKNVRHLPGTVHRFLLVLSPIQVVLASARFAHCRRLRCGLRTETERPARKATLPQTSISRLTKTRTATFSNTQTMRATIFILILQKIRCN